MRIVAWCAPWIKAWVDFARRIWLYGRSLAASRSRSIAPLIRLRIVLGKAVKVISALLPSLPGKHRYTVIYMVRPTEQVVDSQWAMLSRQGTQPKSEKKHLVEVQEHHSRQIREVLKKSERVTLLEVSFPELVADPEPVIAKLAELLPGRFNPGPAVAACVKPQLFRNRGG